MKIGVSTASLSKLYQTETALEKLNETGAETAEVYLGSFYEYRPEFAKKYKGLFGNIHSVHVNSLNFEPQLFFDDARIRGDGYYWLDQVMRSAQIFGIRNYTFHGIVRRSEARTDYDKVAARLNEIINFCSGYGVDLCLENVRWCLYNSPYIFSELKARCPALSGVLDIKQARKSSYPYTMYLKDMSGAIVQIHISDADDGGRTCLPGQGVYDFAEIFKRLKDEGFDGNVFIETANFLDISELKRSVEFLKEINYKLD